ncbi:Class II abasic (AP) endonuclease, partial [Ascosphaera acerosa]
MSLRLTTWNVNGIRNPFSYQPWKDAPTFSAMFDLLEADIVVLQETKIQRKDLRDDMVVIDGWDSFFSFPKYKKGYSGVAVYTRSAACSPIKAEDGITGVNASAVNGIPFRDLPEQDQIGGYPTAEQLKLSTFDAESLDAEGRCVLLEFRAFVLLGVYLPAMRNETRDEFRQSFLKVFECRVRNLIASGKSVVVMGDLNISHDVEDSAPALEELRNGRTTRERYLSTPARTLFARLVTSEPLENARREDDARDKPVLWDLCRSFHPGRKGMYTCWDTKTNARPGNYGARIDYVLCSLNIKEWFTNSDVQQHLM